MELDKNSEEYKHIVWYLDGLSLSPSLGQKIAITDIDKVENGFIYKCSSPFYRIRLKGSDDTEWIMLLETEKSGFKDIARIELIG